MTESGVAHHSDTWIQHTPSLTTTFLPSTRPFMTLIEKKWIAYQLLCSLKQCHSKVIARIVFTCSRLLTVARVNYRAESFLLFDRASHTATSKLKISWSPRGIGSFSPTSQRPSSPPFSPKIIRLISHSFLTLWLEDHAMWHLNGSTRARKACQMAP